MDEIDLGPLLTGINVAKAQLIKAATGALWEVGQEIMATSQPLVPVDTGRLKGTGRVLDPVETPEGDVEVVLAYGTAEPSGDPPVPTDYAVYVHEDLTAQHTTGQAKFLEQPVVESQADLGERLAEKIKARI